MIIPVPTSDLDNRSYLVFDDVTRRGVIVDPSFDVTPLERAVAQHRVQADAVLLTHGHIDHIVGVPRLPAAEGLPIWIHADDAPMLSDGMINGAPLFGVNWEPIEATRHLQDDEVITLDGLTLRVLHTPGHSPGSVTLDVNDGQALVVGDVLFRGSVGRTDLPGGDQSALAASLRRLLDLHEDAPVYPGHGGPTSLAAERQINPFVKAWLGV